MLAAFPPYSYTTSVYSEYLSLRSTPLATWALSPLPIPPQRKRAAHTTMSTAQDFGRGTYPHSMISEKLKNISTSTILTVNTRANHFNISALLKSRPEDRAACNLFTVAVQTQQGPHSF